MNSLKLAPADVSATIGQPMPRLREIHLYLGCLFAPILIFFAVTGSWQLNEWHKSTKSGYNAPPALSLLSRLHTDQHFKESHAYTPLRVFVGFAAVGLVATTILGVIMAFRFARTSLTPLFCLTAGIAIPVVILYLYG